MSKIKRSNILNPSQVSMVRVDFDAPIAAIDALAQKLGAGLTEQHKADLHNLFEMWHRPKASFIDYPDGNHARLIIVQEDYQTTRQKKPPKGLYYLAPEKVTHVTSNLKVSEYMWNDAAEILHKVYPVENVHVVSVINRIRANPFDGDTSSAKPLHQSYYDDLFKGEYDSSYEKRTKSLREMICTYLASASYALDDEAKGDVLRIIIPWHTEQEAAQYGDFYNNLNPDIRKAVEQTEFKHTGFIRWLGAGGDVEISARRIEAVGHYPFMAPLFSGYAYFNSKNTDWDSDLVKQMKKDANAFGFGDRHVIHTGDDDGWIAANTALLKLRQAVDNAEPIAKLIRQEVFPFDISAPTLKNFASVKRMHGFSHFYRTSNMSEARYELRLITDYFKFMRDVPSEFQPKTAEEFDAFISSRRGVKALSEKLGRSVETTYAEFEGEWGQWPDHFPKPGRAYNASSHMDYYNLKDYLSIIKSQIIIPELWRQVITHEARQQGKSLQDIFNEMGENKKKFDFKKGKVSEMAEAMMLEYLRKSPPAEIMACSKKWHEDSAEYNVQRAALETEIEKQGPQEWMPLSKPVQAPQGIWVHALQSRNDLKRQGDVQNHCVGNSEVYFTQCLAGGDHIVSLTRDEAGTDVLTTLQLREVKEKNSHIRRHQEKPMPTLKIVQHQGYGTRDPFPEEIKAAEWYRDEINNIMGKVTPDWTAIHAAKTEATRIRFTMGVAGEVGFDPRNSAMCELSYNIARPYLPEKLKKLSYRATQDVLRKTSRSVPTLEGLNL